MRAACGGKQGKILYIAVPSLYRRADERARGKPEGCGSLEQMQHSRLTRPAVTDYASSAYMLSSDLKLRLYQRNKISALAQYITDSGIEQRLRDKRHIHNNDIDSTDITARKPACVAALHNADPRVCTQLRSELISAGIHRVNTRGTALEQHLGKASGRRAYVGCDSAASVDFECIKRAEQLGAGEILLNSMDADGTKEGFDLEMIRAVRKEVKIPIIASGGAGKVEDFPPAIEAGADAVLAASVFHYGILTIADVKAELKKHGYTVR